MAYKSLIFLVIFKFATSMPDPNVNINVNVDVDDNGCCPEIDCLWGSKAYPNGAYIEDTCMKLKCNNGNWEYIGVRRSECGECQAFGDPQFFTFDNHINSQPPIPHAKNWYEFNGKQGLFVISQSGLEDLTTLSATSMFESNPNWPYWTAVRSVCYWEPEVTVCAELPSFNLKECYDSSNSKVYPYCAIKVTVNGYTYVIGKDMEVFNALNGDILVFFHNHHGVFFDPYLDHNTDDMNTNCINIVGSAGLSVSLCTSNNNNEQGAGSSWSVYSHLYVWAMPKLKGHLYGMCDTFTGTGVEKQGFTMHNGTVTDHIKEFAESWMINMTAINKPTVDNCATNATLYNEVKIRCEGIMRDFCKVHQSKCSGFETSCEFDLCRVADKDAYAQGYINHMKIESHLNK